ncbi:MAG: hypothetical protein U0X74_14615 [Anaerolineales bacterium]
MKSNNFFSFESITIFIVLILVISVIPILFISGNEVAAIILIVIFGFVSLFIFVLYTQIREKDDEDEDESEGDHKNIDGVWYSNHYMKKIYEAYEIKDEEEVEDNENDESEIGNKENAFFKEPDSEANAPFSEKLKIAKPVSRKLESFEIEDIEVKIKFYKTLRTISFIVLVIVAGVYAYLQKNYPSLLNNKVIILFYIITSIAFIIRFILIFLEEKAKKLDS